jgi:hypothetical protein
MASGTSVPVIVQVRAIRVTDSQALAGTIRVSSGIRKTTAARNNFACQRGAMMVRKGDPPVNGDQVDHGRVDTGARGSA